MDKILDYTIIIGIFASIAMIFFLLVYIVKKPSIFDKLIASDLLAMPLICLIVLVSMYYKTFSYVSLILIIAIICLVGTIVRAKFLANKEVFSDDTKEYFRYYNDYPYPYFCSSYGCNSNWIYKTS